MNRRIVFTFLVLAAAAAVAQAQTTDDFRTWSTVGSAGTVDEADLSKIVLDHATAQFGQALSNTSTTTTTAAKPAATLPVTTAVIRYNVVAVDGLFAPRVAAPNARGHQLRLRYLATGAGGRVIARLIEVDFASGAETTLLTFDSNAFGAATGYHDNFVADCGPPRPFDFVKKAYYVEVTLIRSSVIVSAAGVQVIKVTTDVCPG
jgi:hypothetical protein